jgi:glutamyl endopeptidase
LIGPRTVVTAGHCVYSREQKGWARSIEVAPGADGSSFPFGRQSASDFRSVDKWVQDGNTDFDFGAIILPTKELGQKVGYFGFQSLSSTALKQREIRTSGYPGDKPRGTQWFMAGPTEKVTCGQLFYTIDTYGGQSGSAVWVQDKDKRLAVGIHTSGGCPNKATRIRKPIFDLMMHWKDQ